MAAEEDDLVTHLLLENRKLRQLYLAEQQRALAERKRRIAAEAHLAALLSMKVMEMRKQNSSRSAYDLSASDKLDTSELRRNGRKHSSSDSYNDHIALLVMDNIKKLQKLPFAHKSSAQSMTSSNGTRDSGTTVSSSRPSRSEQTAPLCAKTNRDTSVPEIEVLRETSRGTQPPSLSSFWTFIDRNGKTHSEPLLNSFQQKKKEAFIKRSIDRLNRIKEASARRKELAAQKRNVAKQLLAGHTENRDAIRLLARLDREIHAFSPQTMKRETFRRVRRTRDFEDKKKRRRQEYDAHINRLLAYCYSQVPYHPHRK